MKIILVIIIFFITNCTQNKVIKNHGVLSLKTKSEKVLIGKSNSNDLIEILGPPSTKSTFDNNIWIYIESKKINQSIIKLGKRKIYANNVLILELDGRNILQKKDFYDLDNMKDIKFSEKSTEKGYSKDSYIYNVLSSLREKMNAQTRRRTQKK